MDRFDEKIIGYESTKNILRQILDALKRPELYKSKGASIPRGLLMESDPGLGKSLLATVFIKESGRKSYVFRKTSQENSFLDELRAAFSAAKEAAPSILLLEDLNLYVESNSPYAPEWACLQACIDDAKSTDLFVIATTNDTKYMPPSLLRPGRFDYTFYLDPPTGKTAEKIVSYYLRDKDLAEDVLISDIVKAMPKVSCATLETVMNLAALNSTYQGHEHIYKDDVTDALLQVVYKLQKADKETDSIELQKIALHEAAHAVVGEILNPDSIGIVTIRGNQSCIGGFENGCSTYLKNEEELLNDITKTLAGKAGVSLIYGVMDVNASGDIQNANRLLDLWMTSLAGAGFSEVESANNRMSETRLFSSEAVKAAKMEGLMGLEPTLADGIFADDGALVYFFYADEFLPPENGLVAFTAVPLCAGNLVLDDGSEEECLFIACSFMIDGMDFNDTDRIISNDSHTSKTPDEIINEVKNSWYQDNTDVLFGDEFEVLLTNPKWTYDSTLNRVELTGTYTAYDYPWHGIAMPSDTESDTVEKELHIYFEKINGTGRWTPHFDDNYPNDDYPPEEYQEFEVPGRDDDRMHGLMADVLQYYADTGHYV